MKTEDSIIILKNIKKLVDIEWKHYVTDTELSAIETLLTAYEKEKETSHYIQSQLDIANAKLVEEKEKNKNAREYIYDLLNNDDIINIGIDDMKIILDILEE